jgi:hypothetical protein
MVVDLEAGEEINRLWLLHHRGRVMSQSLEVVHTDMALLLQGKGCRVDLLLAEEVLDFQAVHEDKDSRLL